MAEIVIQFVNSGIGVKQMLELYKDFKRIAQILANNHIVSAIEELLKVWQRNQRYLTPNCSSSYECIQKLITDTGFRNDVLAKTVFCTKWIWKQIIVKSAKELLVLCDGYWNSLKDIIKQNLTNDNDKDIKIKDELEMIGQKIERLKRIVIETKDLITQFEKCDVEDQIKPGQLFKAIETKINQVLQEEVIEIDELKEYIVKYKEEQINAKIGSGFTSFASVIGMITTIVYPPSYFLTAVTGGVSALVVSSLIFSCSADKVKELSQKLTLLEEYKQEYAETMQEIRSLNEKKDQVAVANLTKFVAKQNSNANKIDGCTCGGCKCQV